MLNQFTPPPPKCSEGGSMKRAGIALAAAALVASMTASPVMAQITGTIVSGAQGFTFPDTATLNSNREWEVTYSADIAVDIETAERKCIQAITITDKSICPINPPYIMKYGVLSQAACFSQPSQSAIQGVNGIIVFDAWTQTLRTKPETTYCIAMYASESTHPYHNTPIASGFFTTPPDPDPPTLWNPQGLGQGCGALASLALVQQCYRCKYQGTASNWDFNTNRCVSAGS